MYTGQLIVCIIFLALSLGSFVISYFQFRQKGFLFNNAYVWASKAEREKMRAEDKKPYYRQSGFAFALIGVLFLIVAVDLITEWIWLHLASILVAILAVVYAVASSIQIERHK